MGFGNMQDYVERPKKYATSNNHRSRHLYDELDCNGVSYIVCITL